MANETKGLDTNPVVPYLKFPISEQLMRLEEYSENERVLAFHEGLIYEAKVLKVNRTEESTKYLLHYQGWSEK